MNAEIGEAAGVVWQCLSQNGEMNPSAIAKKTGLKRDLMFAAMGWLAREEKLQFRQVKRTTFISLV